MVSDSPYDINDLVLSPLSGIAAGLVSAFVMLGVVAALQPYSGLSPEFMLGQFGAKVVSKQSTLTDPQTLTMIGLSIHLILRGLMGLLYSVSQQRVPTKGFFAVGIFYGFFIWITGSVIFGWMFGEEWRVASRSWTWLLANLTFGFCLAAISVVVEKIRPAAAIALPKD